jgi:dienelactone hydrolase
MKIFWNRIFIIGVKQSAMRNIIFIFIFIFSTVAANFAQQTAGTNIQTDSAEIVRIDAQPEKGFAYPYYLYVPKALHDAAEQKQTRAMLVIPNNTGKINDDLAFHEADVKRKISQISAALSGMKTPILIPVFPRPETEHTIYTHSLDRDVMLTDKKEFRRFDLQLAAMIDNARERLESEKIKTEKRVLMQGYSASGMFVNRFVFLHPERVKAAAIGAPGGWAIAPVAVFQKQNLTFPAGTGDFREVSGKKFDLEKVRKVPLFMILGGKDTNDAVPMGDAYDPRESELVISLFGKTPVERWKYTEELYRETKLNATFKLYPEATHQMTKEMRDDTIAFLSKYIR